MKKLITLFVLLATLGVRAQTFEGTIHWSMAMQFTDPAMQSQMAEAQKQMNDPQVQASMKELQEKMNDPEMKKMMEQNPQVKAMMENAMKSGQRGGAPGGMDNMMPKGMSIRMKGANVVTRMEGGMTDGMEFLHKEGQPAVRINRKDNTYTKLPEGKPGTAEPQMNVIKTTETAKILGYTCVKYIVEMKMEGQTTTQNMWTTTDIKDIDMKAMSRQRTAQGQPMFSDKVSGFPLKIEMVTPQGNMIMEVTEIKKESLSDSDFTIPAGFKEVKSPY